MASESSKARDNNRGVSGYHPTPSAAVDPGNYRPNKSFFWATTMLTATEVGDTETAGLAQQRLSENGYTDLDGVRTHTGSAYANLTSHVARFSTPGTWHRFAWGEVPESTRRGPYLDQCPYPQVLVASATNDGDALHLTLVPGSGPVETQLGFGGLRPGVHYRLTGPGHDIDVTADTDGRATQQIRLERRTTFRPVPA